MISKKWQVTLNAILLVSVIWIISSSSVMIAEATTDRETGWRDAMNRHIDSWIQQLSEEDKLFADWSSAQYKIRGLGSNQKQWIITLYKASDPGQSPLGYMIIAENPPSLQSDQSSSEIEEISFSLLEYGLGKPLFEEVINDNTINSENPVLVYGGLESYWSRGKTLHDARSGEIYPPSVTPPYVAKIPETVLNHDFHLTGVDHSATVTDPFADLFWIHPHVKDDEINKDMQWLARLSNMVVIFSSNLYNGEVMAPFAVSGIHRWRHEHDEILFVALEDEGARFFPVDYLSSTGSWVAKKQD